MRQRRHSEDDDFEGTVAEIDGDELTQKRSIVLPSYSTKAELSELEPGHSYLTELFASADSTDGELRGESAVLLIRMPNKTAAGEEEIEQLNDAEGNSENEKNFSSPKKQMVEVKTPFFEGGRLKTIISWLSYAKCSVGYQRENTLNFRVSVYSLRCPVQLPPQQFAVKNCVATLENLQFSCEYSVGIEHIGEDNGKMFESLTFSTLSCEQTPSNVLLKCANGANSNGAPEAQRLEAHFLMQEKRESTTAKITTELTNLKTKTEDEEWLPIEEMEGENDKVGEEDDKVERINEEKSQTKQTSEQKQFQNSVEHRLKCSATSLASAECAWTWPAEEQEQRHNSLIGFRTILASTLHGSPANVSILSADQRKVNLRGLSPKAVYRFRIQAVTSLGLGAELVEYFSTGHLAKELARQKMEPIGNSDQSDLSVFVGHFPHSVELPWDSSARKASLGRGFCLWLAFAWTAWQNICRIQRPIA
ncbi:hypothetical protein niasHT_021829 [Heterodera trifolii]|uniref:Fibronectin type-III domain-containing protein n=1 Tax=Heterodera trifolii TaxID=157864 RepID=A0ABD2KIM8_9BILA